MVAAAEAGRSGAAYTEYPPVPGAASRTPGQLKGIDTALPATMALATESRTVHATPPRLALVSHRRSTCDDPAVVHFSVTGAPGVHDLTTGGTSAKPQSRSGPIWPRVQGWVT